ncbi:MAG: 23S rRNA (adenine(2503)-C(2))-methyltransferase RlmN [Armatimonadetes bacterium]|nr:23S rRNA (adenine(2503)-C(2))-methyltransferase RlmN [Armatimonadota bacterium]
MELFGLNRAELSELCKTLGHPSFRAKQMAHWLYRKGVKSTEQMTNLPASLREELTKTAALTRSEAIRESKSSDGTTKFLLRLSDGETIESVLLPYPDRVSVCISTQVGCSVGCAFCATADGGFLRNLTPGEVIDQVLTLQEKAEARVSHVVLMGMGEPLLNLPNVLKAIHILNDEVGISMRRITLSTVGITPAIRKLAELDMQITLAVSLHAPNDELRKKLIPYAAKFPLNDLMSACRNYANTTKRRVTFEYLLIAGVNDSPHHALELSKLLARIMCHVNLIPYNEVAGKPFKKPSRKAIEDFRRVLEQNGIEVTQRIERGEDVSAACGQLKRRNA